MTVYRIRDWAKHFENNRTRELKELRFVIMPNKHDGDGYTELVDHPNGAAHLGAWCSLIQVASKCDPRGTLLRDGDRPHDSASLARLTRLPKGVFEEVLPRLVYIGWIEALETQLERGEAHSEIPQDVGTEPQGDAGKRAAYRMGLDRKEEDRKEEEGKEDQQQRAKRTLEARGVRLPDDFCLNSEMREWAVSDTPDVDLDTAIAEFCDYWRGVPGARGKKLDWPATWRNRMRELQGRRKVNGSTNQRIGYESASERRARNFSSEIAGIVELRGKGSGDTSEDASGGRGST